MSKYSRIKRANTSRLSSSMDFADHSITNNKANAATRGVSNPTQEAGGEVKDDGGEVFGVILGRKIPISCSASSCKFIAEKENVKVERLVNKSFSIKRSISLSEGYSRIHDQHDTSVEADNGDCDALPAKPSKKKGQIFKTWKRFFRF